MVFTTFWSWNFAFYIVFAANLGWNLAVSMVFIYNVLELELCILHGICSHLGLEACSSQSITTFWSWNLAFLYVRSFLPSLLACLLPSFLPSFLPSSLPLLPSLLPFFLLWLFFLMIYFFDDLNLFLMRFIFLDGLPSHNIYHAIILISPLTSLGSHTTNGCLNHEPIANECPKF